MAYYIPTAVFSLSFIPVHLPDISSLPDPLLLCLSSEKKKKKSGLSGIVTEYGIPRYRKTRHIPHSKARRGNPVIGKGFPKQSKESETAPTPIVRNSTRIAHYIMATYMQRI
jgi:hypothetical protein